MLYLIHLLFLLVFGLIIFRWIRIDVPASLFAWAYCMKIVAGLALGYIFTEIYKNGDTLTFFEKAKQGSIYLENQPRTRFFLQLIYPFVTITGNYWISAAWISAVGFLGIWYFTKILCELFPGIKYLILTCFLFIPSVVFWSSGILKGAVSFPATGICIALILLFWKKHKLSIPQIILLVLSGFILFEIKHYLFITVLLFAASLGIILSLRKISGLKKWVVLLAIISITFTGSQMVHPYLTFSRIPLTLYENNQTILNKSSVENRLNIKIKSPDWAAVLSEIPKAAYAGLQRPTLVDETRALGWVHKIENFLLSCFMFMSLMILINRKTSVDKPLVFSALGCILMLSILLPLAAPNLGTLVRYKNAYIPFLFLLSSILPYRYFIRKGKQND